MKKKLKNRLGVVLQFNFPNYAIDCQEFRVSTADEPGEGEDHPQHTHVAVIMTKIT